jgi:hypothetical protein
MLIFSKNASTAAPSLCTAQRSVCSGSVLRHADVPAGHDDFDRRVRTELWVRRFAEAVAQWLRECAASMEAVRGIGEEVVSPARRLRMRMLLSCCCSVVIARAR